MLGQAIVLLGGEHIVEVQRVAQHLGRGIHFGQISHECYGS